MKKNGFTLVELLVVIALIGSLSAAVGVSVNSILNRQMDKEFDKFKNTIEEAACTVVELNKYKEVVITIDGKTLIACRTESECNISTDYLIQEGFIDEELENPKSEKNIKADEHVIKVTWTDGEKKCTYQE